MRVREKANIENQVGVFGHSLAETETDARDENAFVGRLFLKAFVDVRTQFVNIEFRSVDDEIGQSPNGSEMTALLL